MKALINKIIDFSTVDGPGLRTSVFLQGCNIHCLYCHNPETQRICNNCTLCVSKCQSKALSLKNEKVVWDKEKCINCDTCISVCPNNASPKVELLSAEEVYQRIKKNIAFIRGITVSGGECMLNTSFLEELFTLAKKDNLTCLIDSNGTIPFSCSSKLLELTDGVMLDVKSWESDIYHVLTGFFNDIVKENLIYLAKLNKICELRIVCLENYVDAKNVIKGIYDTTFNYTNDVPIKLIKFRKYGVRGVLKDNDCPKDEYMNELLRYAKELGFKNVFIR